MATAASIGTIKRGTDAFIEFAYDEPDPDNAGQRRVRNIATDTITFVARARLGDAAFLTKTSTVVTEIEKTNAANGEGRVIFHEPDFATVGATSDVYCVLTNVSASGETVKDEFRVRIRVVD